MYYLDFVTIIQLLKEFQRSGLLQTELPKGVITNTQETYLLHLKLFKGEITDYYIVTSRGEMIIADQNLLSQVEALGPLEWTFGILKEAPSTNTSDRDDSTARQPALVVPSQPYTLSPPSHTLVPRRLVTVEYHSSSLLTRQQRRVLSLVDNKRNVGQIATLLFSSFRTQKAIQDVLTILQELEALKIITFQ